MNKYTSLAKLYDSFSFDISAKEWAGYIDTLLKKRSVSTTAQMMDAACGTGSITLELYKLGYNIMALDISSEMLEVASKRFAEAGAGIRIVNQDLKNININKKMDAVICINDALNYLVNDDEVTEAFSSIYSSLNPCGTFLFDISSEYKLRSMHDKTFFEENDEGLYIWNSYFDEEKKTLTMELSLYSHVQNDLYEKSLETHVQKAHEASFLKNALWKAGFTDIKVYECFSQNAPKDDTNRIQFSAVKRDGH
jgi:ubiquinone/menaquinone biosynthesis C-methylase UbiE